MKEELTPELIGLAVNIYLFGVATGLLISMFITIFGGS
jgi:hypothetical protein